MEKKLGQDRKIRSCRRQEVGMGSDNNLKWGSFSVTH